MNIQRKKGAISQEFLKEDERKKMKMNIGKMFKMKLKMKI